jgi:hypothetical protein
MSDRRAWAKRALNAIVAECAVSPVRNEAIYRWLLKLATASEIIELVAEFGTQKLPLPASYIKHALLKDYDPRVGAAKALMWTAACAMADQVLPVRACDLIDAKAIIETRWARVMSREQIDYLLAIQASLDDPIVRRRASMVKDFDGIENPTSFDLGLALGVKARLRNLARDLFGENADRVVNIFVSVLTHIPFSRDDGRSRPERSRRRRPPP